MHRRSYQEKGGVWETERNCSLYRGGTKNGTGSSVTEEEGLAGHKWSDGQAKDGGGEDGTTPSPLNEKELDLALEEKKRGSSIQKMKPEKVET